ncbi:MAG: LysR family transcriptional regulator [Ethanoligenens sp.]
MEIKQLTTFSVIAKTGNFSEASKILGYAQPTVTTHIQLLESELNVKLFERLGHRVRLTPQGKRLLYYSKYILKYSCEAISELSSNGPNAGKISIGANESFSVVRLPAVFKRFLIHYPAAEISLKFGSVNDMHEQLQNNTVDVAFFLTREVSFPDLVTEKLLSEQVSVISSPKHPFCTRAAANIKSFENQDLILTQKNCTFRAMIDDCIKQAEVHPRSVIEINNIEAIKQLVISGLGITIMPRISVKSEIAQGLLVEIPWSGSALPVFTQLAYHKDKWLSPTILSFLEETRAALSLNQ